MGVNNINNKLLWAGIWDTDAIFQENEAQLFNSRILMMWQLAGMRSHLSSSNKQAWLSLMDKKLILDKQPIVLR